jgi:site-specific DNA recombinase
MTASIVCAVEDILSNPLYYGYQYVKPWKEEPGGFFRLTDHEPIIDLITWNNVQDKMKKLPKIKIAIADNFPLRGVLKCHCSKLLTGAPSRNKVGRYYNYYKCTVSGHNNFEC